MAWGPPGLQNLSPQKGIFLDVLDDDHEDKYKPTYFFITFSFYNLFSELDLPLCTHTYVYKFVLGQYLKNVCKIIPNQKVYI